MTAELLARVDAPFVFVVGKGGTGKSTTAGALALASADAGRETHLVSTDPAHSLGDVFRERATAAPAPSACNHSLLLEEFDARAYAERWIARAAGPIAELIERGTYLDATDARAFVDLSLPGVDEIMAALRLAEIARERGARRVFVDTAPTGHTLRLLDSGKLLAGWIEAFRAMARKAGVVAASLVKQHVRFAAEPLLDELEAGVREFEGAVLGQAQFVVATRAGAVVRAETDRLVAELTGRGLRVAAIVQTGEELEPQEPGTGNRGRGARHRTVVPLLADPAGCAGLRAWGSASAGIARDVPETGPAALRTPPWLDGVEQEILFFAGKGGVGKSTCAAACALALAERRETTIVSTDPAGSLQDVLQVAITSEGTRIGERLHAQQVDAEAEFARVRDSYRGEVAGVFEQLGIGGDAALDRVVMESLWNLAPPGIDEIFALVKIVENAAPGRTLVIDAAPTGHFLRLIELPEIALGWARALMRLLVKYHASAEMQSAAEEVLRLARGLKELQTRLADPARAAAVVVTLGEPVVAAETARLEAALGRAGVRVAARIHNRATGSGAGGGGAAGGPVDIFAPLQKEPPTGAAALRAFLSRWTQEP